MKGRTRRLAIGIPLAAALVLAGCGATHSAAPAPKPVAYVNGAPITRKALAERTSLYAFVAPQDAAAFRKASAQRSILQRMVQEHLIMADARRKKVTVPQSVVSAQVASASQSLVPGIYPTQAKEKQALKKNGLDQADLTAFLKSQIRVDYIVGRMAKPKPVTSAEIAAYYNAHKSQFATPETYDVRHILVKTKALAEKLLSEIRHGASFSKLAKKYSIDKASAVQGGNLGYIDPAQMVPPFAKAVVTQKIGQYGIVHSQFGWHIVQVLGKRPPGYESLSAATPTIQQTLQSNATVAAENAYVQGLMKAAHIKILLATPSKGGKKAG